MPIQCATELRERDSEEYERIYGSRNENMSGSVRDEEGMRRQEKAVKKESARAEREKKRVEVWDVIDGKGLRIRIKVAKKIGNKLATHVTGLNEFDSGSKFNPSQGDQEGNEDEVPESIDVHFEPVVKLEIVPVKTLEEDEQVFFKARAKLFRFDKSSAQWKERGTGEVRLLQHGQTNKIRILMRRDQTHKICANHYSEFGRDLLLVIPEMKLVPNVGSDRSWIWNTPSDMSESESTAELLAIRFANVEIALGFKEKFEKAQKINSDIQTHGGDKKHEKTVDCKQQVKEAEKEEEDGEMQELERGISELGKQKESHDGKETDADGLEKEE
ncbi:unnamed protein product [Sphagnum compactum]